MKQLRVFSSESACVADLKSIGNGKIPRRFIGRTYDPNAGLKGGFPLKQDPDVVDALPEYIMAVRQGDLVAADEDTAHLCSVTFNKPQNKSK